MYKILPQLKRGGSSRALYKMLLVMKLIMLFLTMTLVQVSAATFGQRITLNKTNVPLDQVINEIREQSGYDFFYNKQVIKQAKPVTINVKNATITEVLEKCFDNQALSYKLQDKAVIITIKEKSFLEDIITRFQEIDVRGRVVDEKVQGLIGATVAIKGTGISVVTNSKGEFILNDVPEHAILVISYIGYKTREVLARPTRSLLVMLEPVIADLKEVSVVSTGYQNIPKERATGSFELVDNKTLNLVTGTNILKRLQGNVTGFDFNNQKFATSSSNPNKPGLLSYLTIRGQNTLYGTSSSGSRVLVVVDGIEMIDNGSKYTEDQIGKLNPNDIESITVLKDAAAESVYGSRAANGVIVITTKRSRYNQPLQLSFNTNTTVTEKPDLFYFKYVSAADYIDLQKVLYGKGYFNSALVAPNANYFISRGANAPPPLVAEILDLQRRGLISETEANAQFADLATRDVRNDLTKYFLRNAALYSNNLSVGGGTDKISYRFSAGHDKSLNNTITSSQDRLTLRSNLGIKLLKNLEVLTDISYTKTLAGDQSGVSVFNESAYGSRLLPYDKLVDAIGNPLPITKRLGPGAGFRQGYIDTVGKGNLLDMNYRPLQDIHDGYTKTNATDINLNLNAIYKLNDVFSANLIYGYQNTATNSADYQSVNSYYTRYVINYFTSYPTSSTPYQRNLPMGGIYNPTVDNLIGHNFRGQLNMNKSWGRKHNISAVAGASVIMSNSLTRSDLYYGYDDYSLIYQTILDFKTPVQAYAPGATRVIQFNNTPFSVAMWPGVTDNTINTTKAYFNAAYSYRNLYTLSGSIAKDQSNIFGADANKSFKPYYSSGLRWNIDNERFYKISWLPVLSIRTTFGYNGNLNYTYKPNAYLVYVRPDLNTGLLYGNIEGGSNNNLRPEKTAQLTFALDFGLKNNRVTGNIEVYQKWNSDLIGNNEVDRTTGFLRINYNTANMKGRGIDLTVHTVNLKTPSFSWNSSFRISHNEVIITKSYIRSDANGEVVVGTSPFGLNVAGAKIAGGDVNSIYAYKWAGLSAVNGAPQGYLNGVPSTNYDLMTNGSGSTALDPVIRVGSASPTWYGSVRNSLEYKNFTITASILYKMGYYFRKTPAYSIAYNDLAVTSVPPAEYYQRWQHPGDERYTNVPAFIYPTNTSSDNFYRSAEINVLKGDHIRLQEVSLFYNFNKRGVLKNTVIYGNVQELGIIWRANKQGIDPDALDLPRPRTYALGLSKTF